MEVETVRKVSKNSKKEYLETIRLRYGKASKGEKALILDEFCTNCGYNRKYAIRILNKGINGNAPSERRAGRPAKYDNAELKEFLKTTWKAANLPCSKRLKAMIPIWLPKYEQAYGRLSDEAVGLAKTISAWTIDRIFGSFRRRYNKRGFSTTKPGSIIKEFVPIKTDQWDETRPGYLEADTVAHCGASMAGMFVFSLDMVDIATGWTFQRALWGKGERGVLEAMKDIESITPFKILGFDCDSGSEFLNWHLLKYFKHRKSPVQYTRSRPYHKNDNAHVEQKNWTHVRQYLGYERFDKLQIVDPMNDLYSNWLYKLVNYFLPSVKLISKDRIGSKIVKKHDEPKTPFQRILESEYIAGGKKDKLKREFEKLNPYTLEAEIRKKIKQIMEIAS